MRRIIPVVFVAALVAAANAAAAASPELFTLADPRLAEVSGIAAGIASPGVVYVHNDSGDVARFFALDGRTGRVLATYAVPGVTNTDWEDIAVGRDARGVASVWIGDIGDNDRVRTEVEVMRVDEPHVDLAGHDVAVTTAPPDVWRLHYPDGAVDAESLAVAPGGAAYIVTKSVTGSSGVYAVPSRADAARVQDLRRIGTVTFRITGTPGPFAPLGQLAATGADIARDGSLLVIRTYTDAYVWRLSGGDVAAALPGSPARVALPRQPQGEGIAFDGARLLVDSEQVGSAVYSVPIPAAVTPTPSTSTATPTPTPSSDPLPPVTPTPGRGAEGWVVWLLVIGAALLIATPLLDRFILRRGSRTRRGGDV